MIYLQIIYVRNCEKNNGGKRPAAIEISCNCSNNLQDGGFINAKESGLCNHPRSIFGGGFSLGTGWKLEQVQCVWAKAKYC